MFSIVICPLCRLPLDRQPRVWTCPSGHSFDVAREGYVNLLPVQYKRSREPGDRSEMVLARREFLQAGHYEPLRNAAVAQLAALEVRSLLDIGCGEGYYTSAFADAIPEVIGLDIAKPAIQLAARRHRNVIWLVGSSALLPLADASVAAIVTLFTPLHIAEMTRVLAVDGHVLIVTPAPDHLESIRDGLFDEVRVHRPDKFLADFEPQFNLVARQEVRVPLALTQVTLRQLLTMTPYAWKAKLEKRARLEAHEHFETEAAFMLMLFRKRS